MADLGMQFDATTVEPNATYEPVPTGWYKVSIIASELKETKNGEGHYLLLEMDILEGPYEGRKLWDRLNLQNPNPVAVDIAYRTLSSICYSIGIMSISDSEQLHGHPLLARVVLTPAKGDFDAKNDIKGYRAVSSAPSTPGPRASMTSQTLPPLGSHASKEARQAPPKPPLPPKNDIPF